MLALRARLTPRYAYGSPDATAISLTPTSTDDGSTWTLRLPRSTPRDAVLALAGLYRGGDGMFGVRLHRPPDECDVGAPRPRPPITGEGFSGVRPIGPRLVLGCARLPASERVVELIGYRHTTPRGRTALCIDTAFESGESFGCGSNLIEGGRSIDITGVFMEHRFALVSGTASARVRAVWATYRRGGRRIARRASLVRVVRRSLLTSLGIRRPFARYLFEVPRDVTVLDLEGRDTTGRVVGRSVLRSHHAS